MLERISDRSRAKEPRRSSLQLLIMLAALAGVVGLMLYLRSFGSGSAVPSSNRHSLTYESERFDFAIHAPNSNWLIQSHETSDSVRSENPLLSVRENTAAIVTLRLSDSVTVIAQADIGVMRLVQPRSAVSLASQSLQQIITEYTRNVDTVRVVVEVTPVASRKIEGAYFVVALNRPAELFGALDLWVMTYIVRNDFGFAVACRTDRKHYGRVRDDLTRIIESFRFTSTV